MRAHDDYAGDWQGLDSSDQAPRYAAIAEMLRSCKADGQVLDVGCGEAVQRDWLPKSIDNTGIEPSAVAIERALRRDPSLRIVRVSAEGFSGAKRIFGSIVLMAQQAWAVLAERVVSASAACEWHVWITRPDTATLRPAAHS